jgi:hypothetical protein
MIKTEKMYLKALPPYRNTELIVSGWSPELRPSAGHWCLKQNLWWYHVALTSSEFTETNASGTIWSIEDDGHSVDHFDRAMVYLSVLIDQLQPVQCLTTPVTRHQTRSFQFCRSQYFRRLTVFYRLRLWYSGALLPNGLTWPVDADQAAAAEALRQCGCSSQLRWADAAFTILTERRSWGDKIAEQAPLTVRGMSQYHARFLFTTQLDSTEVEHLAFVYRFYADLF